MIQIPTRSDLPFYDLQVTLDGVTYTLEFRWNVRAAGWFMAILDAEGVNVLRAGIRLVANWPLEAYRADRQPRGVLMALDTSSSGLDPGRDDLGDRVQLVYISADELGR